MEHIFSLARILTSLKHCKLGLDNFNNRTMILKNWHVDAWPSFFFHTKECH